MAAGTPAIEAAYIHLSSKKVVHTREIKVDVLLADYSADGKLVGIEILAPVTIEDLQKLVKEPARKKSFRKFVKTSAPSQLITA